MYKVLSIIAIVILSFNYNSSFAQSKKKVVKKTGSVPTKARLKTTPVPVSPEKIIDEVRIKITTSLGDIV